MEELGLSTINVVVFVVCLIVNGLNSAFPCGKSNKQISDEWKLRFLPDNPAFGIWGIIYTLLLVFTVYQALPESWLHGMGIERNDKLFF